MKLQGYQNYPEALREKNVWLWSPRRMYCRAPYTNFIKICITNIRMFIQLQTYSFYRKKSCTPVIPIQIALKRNVIWYLLERVIRIDAIWRSPRRFFIVLSPGLLPASLTNQFYNSVWCTDWFIVYLRQNAIIRIKKTNKLSTTNWLWRNQSINNRFHIYCWI